MRPKPYNLSVKELIKRRRSSSAGRSLGKSFEQNISILTKDDPRAKLGNIIKRGEKNIFRDNFTISDNYLAKSTYTHQQTSMVDELKGLESKFEKKMNILIEENSRLKKLIENEREEHLNNTEKLQINYNSSLEKVNLLETELTKTKNELNKKINYSKILKEKNQNLGNFLKIILNTEDPNPTQQPN